MTSDSEAVHSQESNMHHNMNFQLPGKPNTQAPSSGYETIMLSRMLYFHFSMVEILFIHNPSP